MRMQAHMLPDGRRLHLQDGPIDLIIGAEGAPRSVDAAYRAAALRFATVLDELCSELPLLRQAKGGEPSGNVARRMWQAVRPYREARFITPMAAVAGAVAEEILRIMTGAAELGRAFVNNGGDIAVHLASNATIDIGLVDRPDRPSLFARALITAADDVRGVATSGCIGRSFSLGIADAVTVLARTAAEADAAATLIANDVDLPGHPAITRRPARELQPDNDLGAIPVTVKVGSLSPADIGEALSRGEATAAGLIARGLISAAALRLAGETRFVPGHPCRIVTAGLDPAISGRREMRRFTPAHDAAMERVSNA
jgi:ApbE superfamily uncharacterized protein (UPF0280 family)